ncbi:MAG: xanthine dehydrogenase [Paenibacillus sp.]|nr:xanthine dehydrogenase [Paenibacillus sp.]
MAAENAGLGMAHSLHAGLDAAVEREAPDAIIVLLADQPFIHERMINRLIETFEADLTLDYVASGDQGIPKPPVLLASSMFGALRKLQGDEGARKLLMKPGFRGLVLEEQDPWCFADLDTPEDIERYKKRTI